VDCASALLSLVDIDLRSIEGDVGMFDQRMDVVELSLGIVAWPNVISTGTVSAGMVSAVAAATVMAWVGVGGGDCALILEG